MITKTTIGDRIGDTLRARRMTPDDLAFEVRRLSDGRIRCTSRSVTNWTRRGTEPRSGALPYIAQALRVSVDWLVSGDPDDGDGSEGAEEEPG